MSEGGIYPSALPEGDPIPTWGLCLLSAAYGAAWAVLACVYFLQP